MPTGNPSAEEMVNKLREEMGVGKPTGETKKTPERDPKFVKACATLNIRPGRSYNFFKDPINMDRPFTDEERASLIPGVMEWLID